MGRAPVTPTLRKWPRVDRRRIGAAQKNGRALFLPERRHVPRGRTVRRAVCGVDCRVWVPRPRPAEGGGLSVGHYEQHASYIKRSRGDKMECLRPFCRTRGVFGTSGTREHGKGVRRCVERAAGRQLGKMQSDAISERYDLFTAGLPSSSGVPFTVIRGCVHWQRLSGAAGRGQSASTSLPPQGVGVVWVRTGLEHAVGGTFVVDRRPPRSISARYRHGNDSLCAHSLCMTRPASGAVTALLS